MDYKDRKPIEPESAIPDWARELGKCAIGAVLSGTFVVGFAGGYIGATVLQREFPKPVAKYIAIEATDLVPKTVSQDSLMYYPLKAGSYIMRACSHVGFAVGDVVYELFIDRPAPTHF